MARVTSRFRAYLWPCWECHTNFWMSLLRTCRVEQLASKSQLTNILSQAWTFRPTDFNIHLPEFRGFRVAPNIAHQIRSRAFYLYATTSTSKYIKIYLYHFYIEICHVKIIWKRVIEYFFQSSLFDLIQFKSQLLYGGH